MKCDETTGYPADWKARSRFVRFYRARNRCEWCGAENRKPHPITGNLVTLTVAHIHDKDPGNASLLNLAALCNRCHFNHDRPSKRKIQNPGLFPSGSARSRRLG